MATVRTRGGAENDLDNSNSTDTPIETATQYNETSQQELSPTKNQSSTTHLWTPGALFQLNDDIKSEVSQIQDDDSKDDDEESSENSAGQQRGGALVKPKPPARRFHWLTPLDTHRVAPSSSRIHKDVDEDATEEGSVDDSSNEQPEASKLKEQPVAVETREEKAEFSENSESSTQEAESSMVQGPLNNPNITSVGSAADWRTSPYESSGYVSL